MSLGIIPTYRRPAGQKPKKRKHRRNGIGRVASRRGLIRANVAPGGLAVRYGELPETPLPDSLGGFREA